MGQQSGGGTPKWVIGCGIGCAVAAIIGILVVVFAYFAATRGMSVAAKELAAQLNRSYTQMKSENKVPADHLATFDEMVAAADRNDASMWTVAIVNAAVGSILADGQVTNTEAGQAKAVHDFVVANPSCSVIQMSQFFAEHPELAELQMRTQSMGGTGALPEQQVPANPADSAPQ